jgi:steroid delta-isomerase-like uncharacterized protein
VDILALTRRWFTEVWGEARMATVEELLSDEVVGYGLAEEPLIGKAGFYALYGMWRDSFSEIEITIHDCIAMDDKSACHFTCTGKHTGTGLGFPPTGKEVAVPGMCFLEWKDGKVVRAVNQFDRMELMRQLGMGEFKSP